jgi:hypothetical protein
MKSTFVSRVATTAGLLLGAFALSALAATWTAPTVPAPGGNPDAPINVGSLLQNKLGWLGVKGLVTTDLTLATGTPAVGKVLTAIDALGNATWATPAGGNEGNWETGEITLPCQAYAWSTSQNVTFTKIFAVAPKIITQPKWERYTGNESAAWWVTNVTTTGFTMNYGTPNSGSCYPSSGGNGIMWVAVGQGSGAPSGGHVANKFTTKYTTLMSDPTFYSWVGNSGMPTSGGSDRGWYIRTSVSPTRFADTANRLCSYFMTNGTATVYSGQYTGGDYGSDNNNTAYYWNTGTNTWSSEAHGDDGSIDITSLICVGDGVLDRGVKFLAQ